MKAALRCCSLLMLSAMPAIAMAQSASPEEGDAKTAGLDEIIVTAQKRSENLQKVPITVTALEGDSLVSLGATSTRDLASVVPGLVLTQSITNATPFLRGVGQTSGAPGLEPSVAFYFDGVYFPTGGSTVLGLGNVAQIAVLKGPQGTLFGRNSTGGVIQVTTRTPESEPTLEWDLGYGNYDTVQGHIYAAGAIGDNIRTSLALMGLNQADGWGRNITTGSETFTRKEIGAQSKTVFSFGATDVTANFLYTKNRGDVGTTLSVAQGSLGADGVSRYLGEYIAIPSLDTPFHMEQGLGSLTVEHDFGGVQFKAMGSYQGYEDSTVIVQNGIPFGSGGALLFAPLGSEGRTLSAEMQLQSPDSSRVQWIVGLYALRDRTSNHYSLSLDTAARLRQESRQVSRSYAVFGQASMDVFTDTTVTLGARYTIDEKSMTGAQYTPGGVLIRTFDDIAAAGNFPTSRTWKQPTFRLSVDHKLSPDVMIFASYNRGFKSGLFNLITLNNRPADPEKLDAFEVGAKTTIFDRRLRLNLSGFYYDYSDLQTRTVVPPSGDIVLYNAAAARIMGIDLDLTAAVTDNLEITGGFEYLDSEYRDFPRAICTTPRPTGGNLTFQCDRSGQQLQRAPKFAGNIGFLYTIPLGSKGSILLSANDSYNSGFPWEVSGRLRQDSYHNLAAAVKWATSNEKFFVRLWGANLANEKIRTVVGEGSGDVFSPGAPRTYGITVGGQF